MKKVKYEKVASVSRLKLLKLLLALSFLYLIYITFRIPFFLDNFLGVNSSELNSLKNTHQFVGTKFPNFLSISSYLKGREKRSKLVKILSGSVLEHNFLFTGDGKFESSELNKLAKDAIFSGDGVWREIVSGRVLTGSGNGSESCPNFVSLSGDEFVKRGKVMVIPCGLELGSHVTVVGKPYWAHSEKNPKIRAVKYKGEGVMVSQFMVELQGLRNGDGEDVPKMLHFNPRLKGDFSGRAVIEQNTCYHGQWGSAMRCEGWKSNANEETVDGQVKCEKWIRDDDNLSEETKATWWLNRLGGPTNKVPINWPFPFEEDKLFVLTLYAGLEGYHVNVDGRHVTSFPYRTGFSLEDATGISVRGDVCVHSIYAAALPTSHPSFAPQRHLEMLTKWQAPSLPNAPVEFFIGILSASNHFAERMAVRKSWMQHETIKSLSVVARFFVALDRRKEVNVKLIEEADFFGDIVVVPYMENYDLLILKTLAICEYGVRKLAAKYIMKCDDDTFVRIDAVMEEAKKVLNGRSLYIGNINYNQKPSRHGKGAVTHKEWPEEDYPPYADGMGYIISSDIAHYVVSEFEKHKLPLFKMEDVSMGMWVRRFNSSRPVEYVHSLHFCQFGCIQDYYTAHYQSPAQMVCLWEKLERLGEAHCCSVP